MHVLFADFIIRKKLFACARVGPLISSVTVELSITVLVLIAELCFWNSQTNSIFARVGDTLPIVGARPPIIELVFVVVNSFAVRFGLLFIELTIVDQLAGFGAELADVLGAFVNPSILVRDQAQIASYLLIQSVPGVLKVLVPSAVVDQNLLVWLPLVMLETLIVDDCMTDRHGVRADQVWTGNFGSRDS